MEARGQRHSRDSLRHGLVLGAVLGAVFAGASATAAADHGVQLEFFLGAAINLDAETDLAQAGHPDLLVRGAYETRPFEFPLYYAWRVSWRTDSFALELQLVHHKMHLVDPPAEVQQFEISHGLNLLTANYTMRQLPVELRFGVGLVVAHPESIVRNAVWSEDGGVFGSGYHLTGPAFLVGLGRAFPVSARWSVVPEVFVTTARTHVPIADGEASLTHVAFHATLGLRLSF